MATDNSWIDSYGVKHVHSGVSKAALTRISLNTQAKGPKTPLFSDDGYVNCVFFVPADEVIAWLHEYTEQMCLHI